MKLLLSLVGLNAAQDLGYIQCTQGCVNRNRNNPYGLLQCQEWCNDGASIAPCENGIHLNPDDETCSSFYRCTDGVRLDNEYCPEGTRFDQVNQRCLWADTVPCNEKKYELTASDIPFGRVYAACLWSCRGSTRGYATWYRDFYCYVECKDRINPARPEKCEDGTYRSDDSCSSFYTCNDGIRFQEQSCPDGLKFNGSHCDWPNNVDCVEENLANPVAHLINKPCTTGIYQVRGAPNKFYQCTKGIKHHEQSCPAGLLFNERDGICDWPRNVEVLPEETAASCFDGLHGSWYSSDWFYYCYDNSKYWDRCPTGLTFNSHTSKCDWPNNVELYADLLVDGITSQTLKDVEEIKTFLSCFWDCSRLTYRSIGYWGYWWSWREAPLRYKYQCSKQCIRQAARNRRSNEDKKCTDGFIVENNTYTECRDGIKMPSRVCPKGLHFDLDAKTCVPLYQRNDHL